MAQDLNIYAKYVAAGSSSNQIYQDCIMAGSSSQDATETAFPTNTNPTNLGYTYLSSATVKKTYSTNTYAVLNPTSADLHTRGQVNYWITGSTIIPADQATITSASWANVNFANNSISASIATGSIAKIAISSSHFTRLFKSSINDSNDVKGFSILSYNGIVSTLNGYNQFSSSINGYTSSYVVMYVSASRANMNTVGSNPLYVTLGTTQNRS